MKCLHENEKKQTITISIAAGTYDTEVIVDLINQAIQDNEDLRTYRQKTKLVLSNGKNFFREIPNQSSDILQHSQNRPAGDRWLNSKIRQSRS